jgi:hypothetical protein
MSIENGQPEIAQPERKRSARRGWIEFIIAVVLVLAAPIVVSVQSGEANEPWDEIWLGNWPVLVQQDTAAADAGTEVLRLRGRLRWSACCSRPSRRQPGAWSRWTEVVAGRMRDQT